jgi:hypothetical protein
MKDKNLVQELKYKLQITENDNKRLKDQVKDNVSLELFMLFHSTKIDNLGRQDSQGKDPSC